MIKDDLAALGSYLHGERWQSPLARDLQVNDRTMRRWLAAGEIPPGGWEDLLTLAACRYVEKQALRAARNGLWGGGGKLTFRTEPAEWSAETDLAIKERAAGILRDMGIDAKIV